MRAPPTLALTLSFFLALACAVLLPFSLLSETAFSRNLPKQTSPEIHIRPSAFSDVYIRIYSYGRASSPSRANPRVSLAAYKTGASASSRRNFAANLTAFCIGEMSQIRGNRFP